MGISIGENDLRRTPVPVSGSTAIHRAASARSASASVACRNGVRLGSTETAGWLGFRLRNSGARADGSAGVPQTEPQPPAARPRRSSSSRCPGRIEDEGRTHGVSVVLGRLGLRQSSLDLLELRSLA
jgi:hypothetical protein